MSPLPPCLSLCPDRYICVFVSTIRKNNITSASPSSIQGNCSPTLSSFVDNDNQDGDIGDQIEKCVGRRPGEVKTAGRQDTTHIISKTITMVLWRV